MSHRQRVNLFALLLVASGVAGCSADNPLNSTFALRADEARTALDAMAADPKPLERPVVVLGGIFDPGPWAADTARQLRGLTTDGEEVIEITFFGDSSFDRCRARLVDEIDEHFPSEDPDLTREVDVVAISMGGLVARYAATATDENGRRVRIRRLFTICTPHRGAKLAWVPTLDERIVDMRFGSPFLSELNGSAPDGAYELYPYARLGDWIVGEENCAPPGEHPWWVANMPFSGAHSGAHADPRILADIGRRLRGEPAFATRPAAPLPGHDEPPAAVDAGAAPEGFAAPSE